MTNNMKDKQIIPFDVEKAKQGAKLVTRSGKPVRLVDYNVKDKTYPLLGLIEIDGKEIPELFTKDGLFNKEDDSSLDLFIEEEIIKRMTNQQLAWWLRDYPEEHREYSYGSTIYSRYNYKDSDADYEIPKSIRIRRNGGAWILPLVTQLDLEPLIDKDT